MEKRPVGSKLIIMAAAAMAGALGGLGAAGAKYGQPLFDPAPPKRMRGFSQRGFGNQKKLRIRKRRTTAKVRARRWGE